MTFFPLHPSKSYSFFKTQLEWWSWIPGPPLTRPMILGKLPKFSMAWVMLREILSPHPVIPQENVRSEEHSGSSLVPVTCSFLWEVVINLIGGTLLNLSSPGAYTLCKLTYQDLPGAYTLCKSQQRTAGAEVELTALLLCGTTTSKCIGCWHSSHDAISSKCRSGFFRPCQHLCPPCFLTQLCSHEADSVFWFLLGSVFLFCSPLRIPKWGGTVIPNTYY